MHCVVIIRMVIVLGCWLLPKKRVISLHYIEITTISYYLFARHITNISHLKAGISQIRLLSGINIIYRLPHVHYVWAASISWRGVIVITLETAYSLRISENEEL